jgi:hypothetical protein
MKLIFSAAVLCAFLVPIARAAKTVLPDACGDDKVKFDVSVAEKESAPAGPAEGKAQIIFAEDQEARLHAFHKETVRFGMDGGWVGGTYGNAYFPLTVDPGVHHLCVNWEGNKNGVEVTSFTAEPGKTYYFAAEIAVSVSHGQGHVAPTMGSNGLHGGGMVQTTSVSSGFSFVQLNEDEGKYRVKAWKLATWKTK